MSNKTAWVVNVRDEESYFVRLEDEAHQILHWLPYEFDTFGQAGLIAESLNKVWDQYTDPQESKTLEGVEKVVDDYLTSRTSEINNGTSPLAGLLFVRATKNKNGVAGLDEPGINISLASDSDETLVKMITALLSAAIRTRAFSVSEMQNFIGEIIQLLSLYCTDNEAIVSDYVQMSDENAGTDLSSQFAPSNETTNEQFYSALLDLVNGLGSFLTKIGAAPDTVMAPVQPVQNTPAITAEDIRNWEIEDRNGNPIFAGDNVDDLIEVLINLLDKSEEEE